MRLICCDVAMDLGRRHLPVVNALNYGKCVFIYLLMLIISRVLQFTR